MIWKKTIATSVLPVMIGGFSPQVDLNLSIDRVRNDSGVLRICVTQDQGAFPDCSSDPRAAKRAVPASTKSLKIEGLAPGVHAIAVLHDENDDGRMNSFLGIPREGFGFSGRSGGLRPPTFDEAAIDIHGGTSEYRIRMRYIL